ncbi:flavocytochrome c [Clostridium tetani]|uniref:Urocanate reductase n=1 Tax=Clostridium tetani (strain Massachusetts / E88) TaxID=212717 RepID=Q893H7_CLOTE|nr:flavocytochrome c [Clostridium tetani]AAO36365.1 fumarate reductase flavoprotein subunit [Clostridium tetani E88]KGI37673.1 cytochrome C [Clostridium tetani]KGI45606.1 cytochrome C [Clostridium tetani]KHO31897.1 cytochrome C [Clostridium tetani]KIG21923.1 cytochrome C [Clostridium tetani]
MKKFITILLAIFMTMSLVACGNSKTAIPNGKYKGEGNGKGGKISLEIAIKDDAIIDIKVLEQKETPGYDSAMKTLTKNIISTNSLDIDGISGCTLTSNGFLEAVKAALKSAGATPDMLKKLEEKGKDKSENKKEVSKTHDIVVVGAGGAGLCAAIEAKQAGRDVIVLEKMPMAGGNTLISGAEYAAPNNWIQQKEGIKDSVEQFTQDIIKGGDSKNNPELVKVVAENALEGAKWLKDEIGVKWQDELMFFGGHSVKRSLIPAGANGKEIINKQVAKAKSLNIPILYETPATSLITDKNGKVTGIQAESKDTKYTFNTNKAVIIASGGFGSNLEMRVKYNPEIDEKVLSTNTVGSTGDGIVMAEKVGAALDGMKYIQTYPICDPLTGTLLYFGDARLYGHTIMVNKEGKRFVEELERRDVISMAIKKQTGSVCYQILDQKGLEASKLEEHHAAEIDYLYKNKLLVKADTLEEAAKFFDINVKELKASVDRYNGYVKAGRDEEFNKRSMPSTIEKGPYYILKAAPAVHHTMGGIKINTKAQVINKDGKVIEGLFGAGEVTGGIHGTNRLGSNALADITVFGRIAGQNAAK